MTRTGVALANRNAGRTSEARGVGVAQAFGDGEFDRGTLAPLDSVNPNLFLSVTMRAFGPTPLTTRTQEVVRSQ
jgi:hypothetical protein